MSYRVVEENALQALQSYRPSRRENVLRALQQLATNPHQPGDFSFKDASLRPIEVKLLNGVLVTYWADHATSEVRVVQIEPA